MVPKQGFPASAGVEPRRIFRVSWNYRFPRMGGGGAETNFPRVVELSVSPHGRGWSRYACGAIRPEPVSRALVEVVGPPVCRPAGARRCRLRWRWGAALWVDGGTAVSWRPVFGDEGVPAVVCRRPAGLSADAALSGVSTARPPPHRREERYISSSWRKNAGTSPTPPKLSQPVWVTFGSMPRSASFWRAAVKQVPQVRSRPCSSGPPQSVQRAGTASGSLRSRRRRRGMPTTGLPPRSRVVRRSRGREPHSPVSHRGGCASR